MAEKDILEKVLLSCKDVFADCWNVLACEGRQIFSAKAALKGVPTRRFCTPRRCAR